MNQPDVVQALVQLGFNLNEGRAYHALLQLGPSTGYEVSQRSAVPRSAVYGVLRRLVAMGAVRSIAGNPERFTPTPVAELLDLLTKRFNGSKDSFKTAAAQIEKNPTGPDAFSVRGYDRILEEAAQVARSATLSLVVSGWPREFGELAEGLRAAVKRKVFVVLFSHAALPPTLAGIQFSYGMTEAELETFWRHRLVMVADDHRSLVAATELKVGDTGVVSETPAIAEVASTLVALDITLLCQRHGYDATDVMAKMLGDRVGRLDTLLKREPQPTLGLVVAP